MIEFKNVTKIYDDGTEAIKDFSLEVRKGEIMTIIGPSGCGKTTTMKMINRLIEPTSGSIYINDKNIKDYNIHELRWNIGYVLQQIALFPHMTIEENISIVPELKKWSKKDIERRSHELLEMVGLDPSIYKQRMPSELSGGQQQRIGVIRALAADPDIIVMDEPFSALDPISRVQLQHDIKKLQKEIKKTIVFVTHDIDEALKLGDRICFMQKGRIVQLDEPEQLVMNPGNEFVKDFLGDRKSPWQISVDSILDQHTAYIIPTADDHTNIYPTEGTFVLEDENKYYKGFIVNGKMINARTLESKMTLYDAAEILSSSDQNLFPVLEGEKLAGVLTYQRIIEYLRSKTGKENGVIRQ
ncbi:ABC transporter ATP-binding protein [Oceanobacillus saliphilus]|uniref:ABC transporter ATP-binding protein n=1 Tax=Oceanobacillus saliphilus TaxID=2925834 RepID=UPI00201E4904|nr:ABC transporter ATP-binding protein [Oceanobacillus saliphilus]